MAELVPGIGHGDRLGAIGNALAGENLDAFGSGQPVRIEAELRASGRFSLTSFGEVTGVGATRAKKPSGSAA